MYAVLVLTQEDGQTNLLSHLAFMSCGCCFGNTQLYQAYALIGGNTHWRNMNIDEKMPALKGREVEVPVSILIRIWQQRCTISEAGCGLSAAITAVVKYGCSRNSSLAACSALSQSPPLATLLLLQTLLTAAVYTLKSYPPLPADKVRLDLKRHLPTSQACSMLGSFYEITATRPWP